MESLETRYQKVAKDIPSLHTHFPFNSRIKFALTFNIIKPQIVRSVVLSADGLFTAELKRSSNYWGHNSTRTQFSHTAGVDKNEDDL